MKCVRGDRVALPPNPFASAAAQMAVGAAIFVTLLVFNLLGDGLRDALDQKSQ